MFEILFAKLLVIHVIAAMVAVGTVTVTDYFHLLGLRDPKFERKAMFIFRPLSNLIILALAVIYISGFMMVLAKPEIMQNPLFWVKFSLVVLVTINGYILHHILLPKIEKGIDKSPHPKRLIRQAAFAGSLSIVSWYSIVVLAITKTLGYTPLQFILVYIIAVAVAYIAAVTMETRKRKGSSTKNN